MYERTKNYWIWKTDWGKIAKIIAIGIVILACWILIASSIEPGAVAFAKYMISALGM